MAYTTAQIKSDLTPKLHDRTLDKLSGDIFDKMAEAARKLLNRIDPPETIRIAPVGSLVTPTVKYIYNAPSDLKGNKIISIIPINTSLNIHSYEQLTMKAFTFNKAYGDFSIKYNNGIKYLQFVNYNSVSDITGYNIAYYSKFLFQNALGVWIEKPTSLNDDDVVVLEGLSYEAFLLELAEICAHEIQAENSAFDINYFTNEKNEAYRNYGADNKSMVSKPQTSYYRKNNRGRYWNNPRGYY